MPNSLGEANNKMISVKYRYLDPSFVGRVDLNVSSNSDIGMSGSFTPFVKLYDGFYFTPEHQPCVNRYNFEKKLQEEDGFTRFKIPLDSFDKYLEIIGNEEKFKRLLSPLKIEIVEKTPEELERKSRRNRIDSIETLLEEEDSQNDNNNESEADET